MAPLKNKSRYSLWASINDTGEKSAETEYGQYLSVEIICNDCPRNAPPIWSGYGKPFSYAFLAVIRHSRRVHREN